MASQSFGKYLVTEVLGSGGMAEVYSGIHPDLGRRVAIKVILPQFAAESTFEERFRREARVVASLRHPHIVQIYDFDVVEGRHFMVMEYLEGGTLKDHLRSFRERKTTMPLLEIAGFVDAMASALDYAHARGAVHRDIKPPNILFTAAREPVLTDFGIAKLLEDSVRLTATGGVVGSPVYMSPEQATGGEIDARSDQYSLGVVLYEMTTGRVPFQGASAVAVMTQHLNSAPPAPRTFNATLPASIEAVLLKALSKRPDDRFSSAGELAQAFRQALAGQTTMQGSSATPTPKPASQPLSQGHDNERTLLTATAPSPDYAINSGSADAQSTLLAENAATLITEPADGAPVPMPADRVEPPQATPQPAEGAAQPPALSERASLRAVEQGNPKDDKPLASASAPTLPSTLPLARPVTQNFNVGTVQAGVVNQGGEQTFSGDLTFNLDFGDVKTPPPAAPAKSAARSGDESEFAVLLEALRLAFAGSARIDRFVRLVTQFHDQLEELPAERATERKQVVKRVQALLMEMTEAKPDPDMVGIMGASLERAVQPLSEVDPDLPTMVTRITSWIELMVQPE